MKQSEPQDTRRETLGRPVVITGAAGYLGRKLVDAVLENTAAPVVALDKYPGNNGGERVSWVQCDLATSDGRQAVRALGDALQDAAVFHLAGLFVKDVALSPRVSPSEYERDNITATTNIVDAILEGGHWPRLFLFSSTACLYDGAITVPTPVELVSPTVAYAETKLDAEREVARLAERVPNILILRLSRVIGLGYACSLPQDIVSDFVERIALASASGFECSIGSSQEVRPYVHVDDLMEILLQVLGEYSGTGMLIRNVTVQAPIRIARVAELVADTMVRYGFASEQLRLKMLSRAKTSVPVLDPLCYRDFAPRTLKAEDVVRRAVQGYCRVLRQSVEEGDYLGCITQMQQARKCTPL